MTWYAGVAMKEKSTAYQLRIVKRRRLDPPRAPLDRLQHSYLERTIDRSRMLARGRDIVHTRVNHREHSRDSHKPCQAKRHQHGSASALPEAAQRDTAERRRARALQWGDLLDGYTM
jgi:hypothetical protein